MVGMPRVVDVGKHKERIASAVWRLVAARGLDVVSLRSVAAEAGISMGQVQHYFSSKDDLLYAGVEHSYKLIERRLDRQLEGSDGSRRELLLALLTALLGEDDLMRDAIRVNIAFAARPQNDERVRALLTAGDDEIEDLCRRVIAESQQAGHTDAELDPAREAHALFALVTGLGAQVAIYQASQTRARETFDGYLQRLGVPQRPPGRDDITKPAEEHP